MGMKQLEGALFACCIVLCTLSSAAGKYRQQPPVPVWPNVFNIQFEVLVEDYGEDWKSYGTLNYNWPNQTFRSDFIDWCLPLFDSSGSGDFNHYTCSFVATKGSMYFVNHTSPDKIWAENTCCLFEEGLAATPPDWMKVDQYNGTDKIGDIEVDVWWYPGTSDPSKPCYGYWNSVDELKTPVRFFGLSSIGPTILDYHNFRPGELMEDADLSLPLEGCDKECEPPVLRKIKDFRKRRELNVGAPWPNWPSCD